MQIKKLLQKRKSFPKNREIPGRSREWQTRRMPHQTARWLTWLSRRVMHEHLWQEGDPGTVSGMTKAISSVTGSFTLAFRMTMLREYGDLGINPMTMTLGWQQNKTYHGYRFNQKWGLSILSHSYILLSLHSWRVHIARLGHDNSI